MHKSIALILVCSLVTSVFAAEKWKPLFNGKNLEGWTIKVQGSELGENPGRVFRVEDGLLTVSYADLDGAFAGRFGHIFYNQPFTNYHFRCEYRFVGKQVEGGPAWARANSGAMLHCRDPQTMSLKQSFPDSLEFQFLGKIPTKDRPTGSLCTPGTYVDYKGETTRQHIIKASGSARPLGEWVTAEVLVKDGKIQHLINGQVVIEYSHLRFDDGSPVTGGWIALQAESHPCQFRKVEIREIK